MDYRIEVEPDTGWGKVSVTGEISSTGLRDLLAAAWNDAAYAQVDKAKWNFLETRTALDFDDMLQLTSWVGDNKQERGPKVVALIASNDLIFGMSRMFQTLYSEHGWRMNVFRSEDDANEWLGQEE